MSGASKRLLLLDNAKRQVIEPVYELLTGAGYDVSRASSLAEALDAIATNAPDLVLLNLSLDRTQPQQLIAQLRAAAPSASVLVTTSLETVAAALRAVAAGADDCLIEPGDGAAVLLGVERAMQRKRLRAEAENLRRQLHGRDGGALQGVNGLSSAMQAVYQTVTAVAASPSPVLIVGEVGTGKEQLARSMHALSRRAEQPFVVLRCAGLSETKLECELFGNVSDALGVAHGAIDRAAAGTLLLDGVEHLPLAVQGKVLDWLQESRYRRVGGSNKLDCRARVIATAERDPQETLGFEGMRADLYYRLAVVRIELPPLHERGGDVLLLADGFLRKYAAECHKPIEGLEDDARDALMAHRWPGNVRELERCIAGAVTVASKRKITAHDLTFSIEDEEPPPQIPGATMADIERYAIVQALKACGGSTHKAAQLLGVSVRMIQYRVQRYGLAKHA